MKRPTRNNLPHCPNPPLDMTGIATPKEYITRVGLRLRGNRISENLVHGCRLKKLRGKIKKLRGAEVGFLPLWGLAAVPVV